MCVTADSLTARRVPAGISKSKLKKVFEKLDADGSGELDKEVLSVYTHTFTPHTYIHLQLRRKLDERVSDVSTRQLALLVHKYKY